jgi:hypothetical protein
MHTADGDAWRVTVAAPPVCDAVLEVTICPMVHLFWVSGGVAGRGEA